MRSGPVFTGSLWFHFRKKSCFTIETDTVSIVKHFKYAPLWMASILRTKTSLFQLNRPGYLICIVESVWQDFCLVNLSENGDMG